MLKRILVPLDRSPISEQALAPAIGIALACGALLDIVLVHEEPLLGEIVPRDALAQRVADEEYVRSNVERVRRAGLSNVTQTCLTGGVASSIVNHALITHADMIVMTSHFRTGIKRVWAGSVADSIVRMSHIPVLMLRGSHRADSVRQVQQGFHRILIPVDGSHAATAVFQVVRDVTAGLSAQLMLVRVVQPIVPVSAPETIPDVLMNPGLPVAADEIQSAARMTARLTELANEDVQECVASLAAQGLRDVAGEVINDPDIAKGILRYASAHDVNLIALSTRGRGASRLLVGSVADAILRDSKVSMLLIHPVRDWPPEPQVTTDMVEGQLPGMVRKSTTDPRTA